MHHPSTHSPSRLGTLASLAIARDLLHGVCKLCRDALRAVDIGATAIIVSNHGGRQLDHAPGSFDVLAEIVDVVDGHAEVILDGGVRRGTDVIKALALGAKACMIGRSYLYGLGAGGEAGVDRALGLLGDEIRRNMALLGVTSVADIDASYLKRVD